MGAFFGLLGILGAYGLYKAIDSADTAYTRSKGPLTKEQIQNIARAGNRKNARRLLNQYRGRWWQWWWTISVHEKIVLSKKFTLQVFFISFFIFTLRVFYALFCFQGDWLFLTKCDIIGTTDEASRAADILPSNRVQLIGATCTSQLRTRWRV